MYEISRCVYITFDEKNNNLGIRLSFEFFDYIVIPFFYIFKLLGI